VSFNAATHTKESLHSADVCGRSNWRLFEPLHLLEEAQKTTTIKINYGIN
jgi:hypothetical protein